jgi:hypothetical protein
VSETNVAVDRSVMTLWERLLDLLPYRIRPLKHCQGASCYVWTANRKYGVPYCHSCDEEHRELRHNAELCGECSESERAPG